MSLSQFKSLHQSGRPLLLANVWDAHSAQLAQEAGCEAIGTSSHAISNSIGLEDGNNLNFDQLIFFVKGIMKNVNIPVSVDLESGFANDPKEIALNIKSLADLGVVGVNLEDSTIINGKRELVDADVFIQKLSDILAELKSMNVDIFINLRTDTYVAKIENALEETIRRGQMYQKAGVDGLFVPLIQNISEIKTVISSVSLPLNVFSTKDGPDYNFFKDCGVHRISSGDAAYAKIMKVLKNTFIGFNNHNLSELF